MTAINVTVLYNKHKYSINYRKLMLCLPDGNLKKTRKFVNLHRAS